MRDSEENLMRHTVQAFIFLYLILTLPSLVYSADQSATPLTSSDLIASMVKTAVARNLTWRELTRALSSAKWIHDPRPIDKTFKQSYAYESYSFSHYAVAKVTIKVSGHSDDFKYLDGDWQILAVGTQSNPKILELIRYHENVDEPAHLIELIKMSDISHERYKCDPKTEFLTFGNVVYKAMSKNGEELFIKDEWDCGNKACAQNLSFSTNDILVNKTKCSADLKKD